MNDKSPMCDVCTLYVLYICLITLFSKGFDSERQTLVRFSHNSTTPWEHKILTIWGPPTHSRFGHYFCSNLYGSAPRGPRGVKKSDFFFSQMKLFSFCAKIAPKRHKLQKSSKLKKKCQKNLVFFDFFKSSSFLGQY